jgi:uncharacterized membrane protein YozB (DUF420 family)
MKVRDFSYVLGILTVLIGSIGIFADNNSVRIALSGLLVLIGWNLIQSRNIFLQREKLNEVIEQVNKQ